jgi:ATP-dependent helicase/nuclease subunit A
VSAPTGQPAPTPEQAAAVATRDRDVFCEAGAGSGKTRVLVGRYCDAVTVDGAGIEEVLAFTFTERAAAELRQRIRRELGQRAAAADAAGDVAGGAGLRALARATESAWVTTIHGFCRRLLATHPVAAGLDPRFRVLGADEADRLRERAIDDAIRELAEAGDEGAVRVIAAYRPWRVAEIVAAAHERLRSQGMAEPALPEVGVPEHSHRDAKRDLTPDEVRAALDARAALQTVLTAASRRYEELKGRRSGLDFADLELRTVDLLRRSDTVAELWAGRFRHVMVDEFQDTNRVQLELVERLRGPETRLFTVGDEHQSIYRFRNADLEVFRTERDRAQADPETSVLPLRGNFRSRPEVLDVANALGEALLDGFTPLEAMRAEAGDGPRAELLLTYEEGKGEKHRNWRGDEIELQAPPSEGNPATVAQARALAERLRGLVDAGAARPGEIVVLLRAFTHVDAYEDALRRFGLEPYVVGGRGYWSQQQVEDVLRLLGVIANPLDDELLFGALASPACGASPDSLWLLRRAAGQGRHVWPALEHGFGPERTDWEPADADALAAIPEEDGARLRRFCAILARLRAEKALLPLDELVERAMDEFRYDLVLLALPDGAGRMANVRKLMRLAAEYEANEGRDLRAFVGHAQLSTRRDEREGLAPVRAEDHPGVRIMTVHGAKGLEFPVVAVPDLDRGLAAGHRSSDIWIGRPGAQGGPARFGLRLAFPTRESLGVWELTELDAEEKEAEAEESCRLVYVAATRAQERLLLSGVFKPSDLEPLTERKPGDSALRRLLPALVDREDLRLSVSMPSAERATELRARHLPVARDEGTGDVAPPPILTRRPSPVPLGHLSYSALDAFKRCGYRFYLERVLGLMPSAAALGPPAPGQDPPAGEPPAGVGSDELPDPEAEGAARTPAPARALGNAVHSALEWSAGAGWADPGADRLARLLEREGLGGEEPLARATAYVQGWLASGLRTELQGLRLRAEAPFVLPVAGTVLRGNIDLLATGPGRTLVIDYKTDRVGAGGTGELGERYATQRSVYALAAAAAGSLPVHAVHVFLERPDQPVTEVFDADALARARDGLIRLVERIREGEFEPAADPYAALCFGCPAAPRLCPRPAWRPRRDAPVALR